MSIRHKVLRWSAIALAVVVAVAAVGFFGVVPKILDRSFNQVVGHPSHRVTDTARDLHRSLLVADLHADSLLWDRDLLKRNPVGHVDLPRLLEGNVALQVFTAVTQVPRGQNVHRNTGDTDNITLLALSQRWPLATWWSLEARALHQAKKLHRLARRAPDRLTVVTSAPELGAFLARRRTDPRQVAGILGLEGAHCLEGRLAAVDELFAAGYRTVGLVHFFDNQLGGSAHGVAKGGLTEFGRRAVRRMEELGMVLDLAHASPRLIDQVLALATRPVIVSHTGVKGTCDRIRNLADRHVAAVAAGGGLIAIGFWPGAVCDPTPGGIVRAIRHVVDQVGIDHVALGSDFDGTVQTPFDASQLVVLTQALLDGGFSAQEVRRIMGGNAVDFFLRTLPQ